MPFFRNLVLIVVILLTLCAPQLEMQAQAEANPLILYTSTDMFIYDGVTINAIDMPEDLNPYEPTIAPDNVHLAFTAPSIFDNFEGMSGPQPQSIWIYDLSTKTATLIADQPEDVVYTNDEINSISRSTPAWSPDGNYLVWGELHMIENTLVESIYSLAIYDISNQTTQLIELDLPPQYGIPSPAPVWAGRHEIAFEFLVFDESTSAVVAQYALYDYAGTYLRTLIPIPSSGNTYDTPFYVTWVQDGDIDYLAASYGDGTWILSPSNGDVQITYEGGLELHNPLNPTGYYVSTAFNPNVTESGNTIYRLTGIGVSPSGVEIPFANGTVYGLDAFAIARDASAIAYLNTDREVYILDSEVLLPLETDMRVYSINWSYGIWQLSENINLRG